MSPVNPTAPTRTARARSNPDPLVVLVVLAAAVLHAGWNAIAHAAEDRLVGFALICSSTLVLGTVLILVGEPVGGTTSGWPRCRRHCTSATSCCSC